MVDTVKILGALLGGGNMSSGSGANILKSVLGAAMSGGQQGGSGGGLGDLLGSVLGGGGQSSGGGGLGGMLGSVLGGGGAQQQSSSGGLGGMLGSVLGGGAQQQSSSGGLGDLLGGVLGGGSKGPSSGGGADLSDLIGSALNQFGQSEQAAQRGEPAPNFEMHTPNHNHNEMADQATIMIRAMINSAKADGRVDKSEQEAILGKLGSVTQDEIDFINKEVAQPLDVHGFAHSVPKGMENQVYAMSLMAIDLDSKEEAKYLHELGQCMDISQQTANQIHSQLGAPALYS